MKVSFELSARDIRYFRDRLKRIRASGGKRAEHKVIRNATKLVENAVSSEPPDFVHVRIVKLQELIDMLRDVEWRLEGQDRVHILDALAYFVDPNDLIPDHTPGIGYLDDAIMVELVTRELAHEIQAYRDFVVFRAAEQARQGTENPEIERNDWLETRRQQLHSRMRRRRRRGGGGGSKRSPFSLF